MIGIAIYILSFLTLLIATIFYILSGGLPTWLIQYTLPISCVICGGLGGVLYCIRAIYLNYSVRKTWATEWQVWYILRPIASLLTGLVSYGFLKSGLLILEAQSTETSSNFGYYALAFVAGLNVDKFISKIEDLAKATWGIEKSRASSSNEEK
jgi:hypothetical protein